MITTGTAVWGLTGGIGAGKSTAADILRRLGIPVVDMDAVATGLMRPGHAVFDMIVEEFGPDVVGADGNLNRKSLANIVFADVDRRKRLENIVHPQTITETMRRLDNYAIRMGSLAFVESALIFDAGLDRQLQGTALVTAPVDVRLGRVVSRDKATRADIERRMAAQMEEAAARERATVMWDNSGSVDCLKRQIVELIAGKST